jgi:hypothetical protein
MMSKEWKLVALGLAAIMSLTACPRKKKSSEAQTPFKGIWVNSVAYNQLKNVSIGATQDPQFCQRLWSERRRFGLTSTINGLAIDAWVIHGNGDVFRYSATQNSASHGYRNPEFREGKLNGTNCRRDGNPNSGYYGGLCGDNTILQLDRQMLSAVGTSHGGHGSYSAFYVQPTSLDELVRISAVVTACNNQDGNNQDGNNQDGNYQQQYGPRHNGNVPQYAPGNIPPQGMPPQGAPPQGQFPPQQGQGQGPEVGPYQPGLK